MPLQYHLMPLKEVANTLNFTIKSEIVLKSLQEDTIKRIEHELEKFNKMNQKLRDLCDEVDEQFFNRKDLNFQGTN